MFDSKLASGAAEQLSIFYGGVGDARHLYATIVSAARYEKGSSSPITTYHFTINDVMPPTFARNLIILLLLEDLANSKNPIQEHLVLATIFYVYCAQIMPDFIYDHLQHTISRLLEILAGRHKLPHYIYVGHCDRKSICKCLRLWSTQGQTYRAAAIAKRVVKMETEMRQQAQAYGVKSAKQNPQGCEKEVALNHNTAMLFPPEALMKDRSTQWWQYMEHCKRTGQVPTKSLEQQIESNWKTNVTIIDIEGLTERDDKDPTPDVGFNPWQLPDQLYNSTAKHQPDNPTCLYDYVSPFFLETASAMKRLRHKLTIEVVSGDLYTALDMIRHSCLESRKNNQANEKDASNFPSLYGRIHMSKRARLLWRPFQHLPFCCAGIGNEQTCFHDVQYSQKFQSILLNSRVQQRVSPDT